MGHALSADSLSYLVIGMAIAVIGTVAVVQTAQLARCYIQPSSMLTKAHSHIEATGLTIGNIVPYPECGSAASLDVTVSTTEPDTENQTYSDRHSAQSEEYMQVLGRNFSGPGAKDRGESIEPISTVQHLQGIGASFAKVECHDEYGLFG